MRVVVVGGQRGSSYRGAKGAWGGVPGGVINSLTGGGAGLLPGSVNGFGDPSQCPRPELDGSGSGSGSGLGLCWVGNGGPAPSLVGPVPTPNMATKLKPQPNPNPETNPEHSLQLEALLVVGEALWVQGGAPAQGRPEPPSPNPQVGGPHPNPRSSPISQSAP